MVKTNCYHSRKKTHILKNIEGHREDMETINMGMDPQ